MTEDNFLAEVEKTAPKVAARVKRDEAMKNHSTFKVGGPARYFFAAQELEELKILARAAKRTSWPFFILGQGSNVLFLDEGYLGLVIKNGCRKHLFKDEVLEADPYLLSPPEYSYSQKPKSYSNDREYRYVLMCRIDTNHNLPDNFTLSVPNCSDICSLG